MSRNGDADSQQTISNASAAGMEKALSLYIHFPWCIQKCPYCDFNSHAIKTDIPENEYIEALLIDLQQDIQAFDINRPIQSIFLGGGTPSLFSPEALDYLLTTIRQYVSLQADTEITLEANPGTFESQKFTEFRAIGINRLSIGIQSFNDDHLKSLGRVHSAKEAIRASEIAHDAGFDNFNLDLMFALPGSTSKESEQDIKTAIDLEPRHISLYQLTLEPNTFFYRYPPKLPTDDQIFVTQKNCQSLLRDQGYYQYEISAFAKDDFLCRHNLNYWQFGDYIGIGAGAHGKITLNQPEQIVRTSKVKHPESFLNGIQNDNGSHFIPIAELPLEFMMNQLRLRKGFSLENYLMMTGLPFVSLEPALSELIDQSLIIKKQQQYQCSEKGWNYLDEILERFIPK
jgi:oxygen-independent coproporphyrinogen-3 oxidase